MKLHLTADNGWINDGLNNSTIKPDHHLPFTVSTMKVTTKLSGKLQIWMAMKAYLTFDPIFLSMSRTRTFCWIYISSGLFPGTPSRFIPLLPAPGFPEEKRSEKVKLQQVMVHNRNKRQSFTAKVPTFHHWAEHLMAWRIKESHASPEEPWWIGLNWALHMQLKEADVAPLLAHCLLLHLLCTSRR